MEKPHIYLILLDSLRSDTLFNEKKSCKTPNLDLLISQGTNFPNAFSSADHTGVSWLSILTSLFPINSKINPYKLNQNIKSFVEIFKENNYKTFCFFPDISFFKILGTKFDDSIIYEYSDREMYEKNKEKNLKNLIKCINQQNNSDSWLNCIHLMDLKYPFVIPDNFNNKTFGKNRQERMLSYLDEMLGKIIETIDIENSIIIFSSDHGDYIPITNKDLGESPNIQKLFKKGKNIFPYLEPVGIEVFKFLKKSLQSLEKMKNKISYSNLEQRSFSNRNENFLFDDTLNVPLIFTGKNIQKKIMTTLVRHVDIFPTICTSLDFKLNENKFDGIDLMVTSQNDDSSLNNLVAYIESGPGNSNLEGTVIGIRTSKFKYFRSRHSSIDHVHLFDIQNDPHEEHNLAKDSPFVVISMEKILSKLQKSSNSKEHLSNIIKKKHSSLRLE